MNHFEGFDGKSKSEFGLVVHADDDAGDADKHEPIAEQDSHDCCGCSVLALVYLAPSAEIPASCVQVSASVAKLEPRGPTLDSPYPIASI